MLKVSDIWDDAKDIFGHADETKLLLRISDAVKLLANKGEIDPLRGFVDLCVGADRCVTLPSEVESLLAVNIGGHPALGRDQLFSFHLNGPGDFGSTCDSSWVDSGAFCTYRDLQCPSKLIAFIDDPTDADKEFRVFGFDDQNRPLMQDGKEGFLVPTIYGVAVPDASSPTVSRITYIEKAVTNGNARLASYDISTYSGTLLGVYEPREIRPSYRRIRINGGGGWVRLAYRRRTLDLTSVYDRIYLHSRLALILAFRAVKKYAEGDLTLATGYEAHATRILTEQEAVLNSVVSNPIQVDDRNSFKLRGIDDVN